MRIGIATVLTALVFTGCTTLAPAGKTSEIDTEIGSRVEDDSVMEELSIPLDRFATGDLFVEPNLQDGEFYEIPGLLGEEWESFQKAENYMELLQARLEYNGVYVTPSRYEYIFPDVHHAARPVTISHYKNFDILFLQYPGYRGTSTGNAYIFENSLFKGRILSVGDIDFNDCFRELDEDIWLTVSQHAGGSGLGIIYKAWLNLNDDQFPAELYYTDYYASGYYSSGQDLDFSVYIAYDAAEEALYPDEHGVPILNVSWRKTVSTSDDIVTMTCDGYTQYTVRRPSYREVFDVYEPGKYDFVDGLEEQLAAYSNDGTEEEKHIARQIIEKFA